jgi:hypothetical protein
VTKVEKRALDALVAWLNAGIYRGGTRVLAVPSPLEQHRARAESAK